MKPSWRLLVPVLSVLAATPAAALQQPGGAVIPADNKLKDYLADEGETIEPRTQAALTPETFDPNCSLTFKVIARGAGQKNSFGWYNVTGSKPAREDLHEFLGCNDAVGTVKVLDIKSHPAYAGGRIGFFIATTEGKMSRNCVSFTEGSGPDATTLGHLYYSERQYNDDNQGADSFIHLVVMDSGVHPQAFYFGWEDLFGGGDNDFEDILTRVEGITCAGGGGDCDTGRPGVCAAGTMQCRDGELACVSQTSQTDEICNGLDDDCDGIADDGDALCEGGKVCQQGACINRCMGGEISCARGLVCNDDGFCVEPSCADVDCPAGEVCVDGNCTAPCDGVTCPLGQVCRVGACVDPCNGITCDAGQICDAGVCKDKCGCSPCPDGTVCAADGRCVETGCESVSCGSGEVCRAGACVDACEGAVCPAGEACVDGTCIASAGTGGSGGSSGTGGVAGGTGGAGGTGEAGAGGDSDVTGPTPRRSSGSGCSAGAGMSMLGLILAGLALRRR